MDYKKNLNLPRTDFPMEAKLTQRESEIRHRWEEMKLYEKILEARRGRSKWILHDGPPYASGECHVGTGQNKILKDMVVKFRTMRGFYSPFVPGWDCHGLPIEHKVAKELGPRFKETSKVEIRKKCESFARTYIDIQRRQFKSLGVLGDWEHPYLTIDKIYELSVIEVFEELFLKGHIYRGKRAIHWCPFDRTALAEAEIEYKALPSPSIYIAFEAVDRLPHAPDAWPLDYLVWTTTPWTLPADVAIAVHPKLEYAVVEYEGPRGRRYGVLAPQRRDECAKRWTIGRTITTILGKNLEHLRYQHPLFGHPCPIVLASYVTVSDGTGLVHTAPGHGKEDFQTGMDYRLPILSPVDDGGIFTSEAGPYVGKMVFDANGIIIEDLRKSGLLLRAEEFTHDYPCCWRCKKAVIFRATEQWFIKVDHANGRERALDAVRQSRWVPKWGQTRISSMLNERPDWCVSRQRAWGVPIPSFYCASCNDILLSRESLAAVRKLFERGGADSWFTTDAKDILPSSISCAKCGAKTFRKEEDIFDVWFESAASHRAVSMKHPDLCFPAQLYLEGTDQHRGWFQGSLLASLFSNGQAPFREVVTHGFLTHPESGDKLSKSAADLLISTDEVTTKYGADLLRLWISSIDFTNDLPFSRDILKSQAEPYKKIRNTFRWALGVLHDFDPRNKIPHSNLRKLDRWALTNLGSLVRQVTRDFENYEFYKAYHRLYDYCVVDLSAAYFAILKDRLYTHAPHSSSRRSAQTAIYEILTALTKMFAPILAHTSDEVWHHIPGPKEESVHLALWPDADSYPSDPEQEQHWSYLWKIRSDVNRELEKLRAQKVIGSSLEAELEISLSDPHVQSLLLNGEELSEIFIVSNVRVCSTPPEGAVEGMDVKGLFIKAFKSPHSKCERCWNFKDSVGRNAEHPSLCSRCIEVAAGH